jgi:Flp pilus assembly pilin Flp
MRTRQVVHRMRKGGEHMNRFIQTLRRDEEGQALVEYALILSLVSIASILVLTDLGTAIGTILQTVVDAL